MKTDPFIKYCKCIFFIFGKESNIKQLIYFFELVFRKRVTNLACEGGENIICLLSSGKPSLLHHIYFSVFRRLQLSLGIYPEVVCVAWSYGSSNFSF